MFDELLHLSLPLFPHLENRENNSIHLIGLLRKLNKLISLKCILTAREVLVIVKAWVPTQPWPSSTLCVFICKRGWQTCLQCFLVSYELSGKEHAMHTWMHTCVCALKDFGTFSNWWVGTDRCSLSQRIFPWPPRPLGRVSSSAKLNSC